MKFFTLMKNNTVFFSLFYYGEKIILNAGIAKW